MSCRPGRPGGGSSPSPRPTALSAPTEGREPNTEPEPAAPTLILASARGLMTRTVSQRDFISGSRWIRPHTSLRLDNLLALLVGAGYPPGALVTQPRPVSPPRG